MSRNDLLAYYSSVSTRDVEWLWYPYIPCGKITLLQGDPGEGKSTFMLNLIAILTTQSKLPDGTALKEKITVIYQCAEDNAEDTIRPRLMSAGADCDRVAFIHDEDAALTLDDDRIEAAIQSCGAKLLVLDPIQAFIGPDMDMQSATKMRTVMRRLADVAERNRCAIVLVGHMNKSYGGKSLYRSLGSIDIAAIARSILMITRDTSMGGIRYMFPVKSSLAPEGEAVAFLMNPDGGLSWIGKCRIKDQTGVDLPPPKLGKKEQAEQLLKIMLSAGEKSSTEIYEKFECFGISKRTVQMAGSELGITAYKKKKAWFWTMKENEAE